MLTSELIEDIAATAEVCDGSKWSAAAVRIACAHLRQFSEPAIRQSLMRCQQEVKGTLALADIIARIVAEMNDGTVLAGDAEKNS